MGPGPSMGALDTSSRVLSSRKHAAKVRRQKKRAERRAEYPSLPRITLSKKYTNPDAISVPFNGENLPAAKGAFVSRRQHCDTSHECTLDELVERGFKVIEWDGRSAYFFS